MINYDLPSNMACCPECLKTLFSAAKEHSASQLRATPCANVAEKKRCNVPLHWLYNKLHVPDCANSGELPAPNWSQRSVRCQTQQTRPFKLAETVDPAENKSQKQINCLDLFRFVHWTIGSSPKGLLFCPLVDQRENMKKVCLKVCQSTECRCPLSGRKGVAINFVTNNDVRIMKDLERHVRAKVRSTKLAPCFYIVL